jgi:putative aldouronate transport system permease protein
MYALSTYTQVINKGILLIPYGITLENITYVLNQPQVLQSYGNTAFVVVVGTLLCVAVTSTFAYPISRKIKGAAIISLLVYFTFIFNGGMIPLYYVVRETGLLNSLWSLIIPKLANPFYVFLMIKIFREIPDSLIESATIDGAGNFTMLRKIVLPLSLPVVATISLFYAVDFWNSFFDATIYLRDADKWTMQVLLRELLSVNQQDLVGGSGDASVSGMSSESIRMAMVVITTLPVMLIYPFLQKYFVKGVMIGAVKG